MMGDDVLAVPVKYMVILAFISGYKVIDTSFEGDGKTVCHCPDLNNAHKIAKLLNNSEGFEYECFSPYS